MRPSIILLAAALVGLGGFVGYRQYLAGQAAHLPEGVTGSNGRIEVERVDIASKYAGRLLEMLVREGDFVEKGAVIARLDTSEIRAQLAAAAATAQRAIQTIGRAEAETAMREAELALAEVELRRASELHDRSVTSQAEVDRRAAQRNVAAAAVKAAKSAIGEAEGARAVADAQVRQIQAMLDDMTLTAPVAGRVEYRLVQTGEVVAAGARVATLLDLSDVNMTVFLPTRLVGRVRLGADARIRLDAASEFVIPAKVSFVAAEAQFTPKTVETETERDKLMYRVKVSIAPDLLVTRRDYVKAGLTGNAYLLTGRDAFPPELAPRLPDARP
ncbi:efflux transporter periplasmic adaptor subunit [Prosthecomicrobium hirschii]|uniref:HlyD family secretion protein n=1 Tax=Prosthecodimorpha hirschii TaxID=665126 RepID=UPI00112E1E63|nr:HlyD family efflux transporter periplasmic adaptor subunit [Prosthecomicrobium hirschii]TPQ48328.1 efflux transporter periplasmic adaptor subunit [Prosthecomicrobium hirschii]